MVCVESHFRAPAPVVVLTREPVRAAMRRVTVAPITSRLVPENDLPRRRGWTPAVLWKCPGVPVELEVPL